MSRIQYTSTEFYIDYAQDKHSTDFVDLGECEAGQCRQRVVFRTEKLSLELNATVDGSNVDGMSCPKVTFKKSSKPSRLGEGVIATFRLYEGQAVSFILRDAEDHNPDDIDTALVNEQQRSTQKYWYRWISGSKYKGRWEQAVLRSLFLLKLLIFEPTGAIVAAPTFSLPEDIGGKSELRSQRTALIDSRWSELGLSILVGTRRFIYHLHSSSDGVYSRSRCLHKLHLRTC